jgi:hypothetical protein
MEKITDCPAEEKPISVPKNSLEEIRLSVREYGGYPFADLRIYYRGDNGEARPSRKGLTVSPRLWPAFVDSLHRLEDELERCGLLVEEEGDVDAD